MGIWLTSSVLFGSRFQLTFGLIYLGHTVAAAGWLGDDLSILN